jgi:hypothetical protein
MDAAIIVLWIIVLILLGVLVYLAVKLIRAIRGRKHALVDKYGHLPSHTELYFEEYFPSLISEWDLITKPKLQRWKKGISGKLKSIGSDIDEVVGYRKDIDKRLDTLEKDVVKLEKK